MSDILIDLINLSKDKNYVLSEKSYEYLLITRMIDSFCRITDQGKALLAKFEKRNNRNA